MGRPGRIVSGLGLIGTGVLVLAISAWQYHRMLDYLWTDFRPIAGGGGRPVHTPAYAVVIRDDIAVPIGKDDPALREQERFDEGWRGLPGFRDDKTPAEADTLEMVRAIHARARG